MYEDDDDWDEDEDVDDDYDDSSPQTSPRRPSRDYRVTSTGPWTREVDTLTPRVQAPVRTYKDQHGRPVSGTEIDSLTVSPQQFTNWVPNSSGGMSAKTEPDQFTDPGKWYSAAIIPSEGGRFSVNVQHGDRGDLIASVEANRLEMAKLVAQAAVGRHARGADMATGRVLRQGVHKPETFGQRKEISRLSSVLRGVVTTNRRSTGQSVPTEGELSSLTEGLMDPQEKIAIINARIDSTTRSNAINSGLLRVDIEDWADDSPTSPVPAPSSPPETTRRQKNERRAADKLRKAAFEAGVTRIYTGDWHG